ncbi:uncharacterized protein LOC141601206 [Silene latifolia]|uniref:uncharacterized protein LOC141601206 n=1 Tax=Silene latifolia TaxID=37657 RepID=UPI003D777F02
MIYAFNDGAERRDIWSKLGVIAGRCQDPWALAGDFNTVINPIEIMGGNTRQNDMDEFIACLDECGMTDISATGAFYTWNNKQEPLTRVYSWLDRFLINQEWLTRYLDMRAHFHQKGCLITALVLVQEEWQKHYEGHNMFSVVKRLKALKLSLNSLNRDCFADIETNASIDETELLTIQNQLVQDPHNALLINKEIETAAKVKELIEARNSYLS